MESVFPSILSLIIGRWSDIHGRKWPLMMSIVGMVLCYTAYLLNKNSKIRETKFLSKTNAV